MLINISAVRIHNPQANFTDPFLMEVLFEAIAPGIQGEIEFRVVYAGKTKDGDQELDSVLVGPVPVGKNKIELEALAPDSSKLSNILDMSLLLLSGFYKDQEFIQVGYYIRNSLRVDPPLDENGEPILPSVINPEDVVRQVIVDEPRVTHFHIPWDGNETELLELLQSQLAEETSAYLQENTMNALGTEGEDTEDLGIPLDAMGEGNEEDDEEDEPTDDEMCDDIDIEKEY